MDNHGWTISVGVCVQCYIATKGQPLHVASTVTKNDAHSRPLATTTQSAPRLGTTPAVKTRTPPNPP